MSDVRLQLRSRGEEGRPPTVREDGPLSLAALRGMRRWTDYVEYVVDGVALSDHLAARYGWRENRLHEDNVCPLGWFQHLAADAVCLKLLLRRPILAGDVDRLCGGRLDQRGKDAMLADLRDERVLFYACTRCGDRGCGGIAGRITEDGDRLLWSFGAGDDALRFSFEGGAYRQALEPLLREVEEALGAEIAATSHPPP